MLTPNIEKLLCIVGPTATGKTGIAVKISKTIPSAIISADSRQVYKEMDIVTGKDHPKDITIEGIDIVAPNEPCSVAVWSQSVMLSLEFASTQNELPIIVGGTGLYVKSIIHPIPTMGIPTYEKLRHELEQVSIEDLQARLRRLNPARFYGMNNSDANNPRRLIRAIEVAEFGKSQLSEFHGERHNIYQEMVIGLSYKDSSRYESAIRERVIARLKMGAVEETKKLLEKYDRNLPSMTAIGYRSLIQYLEGELTKEQLIEKWTADELSYAKRQMTWFRKVPNLQWFDARDPASAGKIAKLVAKWYAKK